ncbi:MAG: DUF423 domain-containing protein [Phycisphaerae bacterium]|nr:DUF423 domain-containing protein [Phycisphaerae bacterium]
MERWVAVAGAVLGGLGVVAGTFAAHGLDQMLSAELLEVFEVGVRYHLFHALAMIIAALVAERGGRLFAVVAGGLFGLGILLFSGALYVRAIADVRAWGMLAPFGGMCLIMGWMSLVVATWQWGRGPGEARPGRSSHD